MKFHGMVSKWFESKGFGFIRRDDGAGPDIFVHINATVDGKALTRGQLCEFELSEDPQGRPRAERVRSAVPFGSDEAEVDELPPAFLNRAVRFGEE